MRPSRRVQTVEQRVRFSIVTGQTVRQRLRVSFARVTTVGERLRISLARVKTVGRRHAVASRDGSDRRPTPPGGRPRRVHSRERERKYEGVRTRCRAGHRGRARRRCAHRSCSSIARSRVVAPRGSPRRGRDCLAASRTPRPSPRPESIVRRRRARSRASRTQRRAQAAFARAEPLQASTRRRDPSCATHRLPHRRSSCIGLCARSSE